jgi:hypothetical protein
VEPISGAGQPPATASVLQDAVHQSQYLQQVALQHLQKQEQQNLLQQFATQRQQQLDEQQQQRLLQQQQQGTMYSNGSTQVIGQSSMMQPQVQHTVQSQPYSTNLYSPPYSQSVQLQLQQQTVMMLQQQGYTEEQLRQITGHGAFHSSH